MLNQRKKIDKYMIHLDKKLGVGSFGTVYIGFQDGTQEKVAIKMLDKKTIEKDEYIKSALLAEIEILKTLKSENIVGFLDVMESTNNYYIVQEYCDGGDLRNLINKRGPLPQAQAIEMIAQVCNGFVELLRQGVIHRDLKPENILLNHNQKVIKICDFGFSKKSNNQRLKNNTIVGTPLYMPIQILKGQAYTSKCDIWALGFIFYELIHGIPPWDAESEYKLIQNIEHQPVKFSIPISPITKDFISRCLAVKEKDRMSWDELLRHQMFNGKFAKVVKEKHQFENKLKTLMGKLRYQINSQNIQLEKLIQKHGLNFAKEMEFSAFQKFMKTIDPDILQQEIRYIFQKLDRDDSNTISLAELETAMVQNNIPLKSHYNFSKKQSISQKGIAAPDHDFTMIEKRVVEAFLRLDQKLKSRKITLLEVFDAYDVNKDGDISLDEFKRIMKRLDSSMGQEDVKMAFQMIDIDSSQTITFEQFNGFYIKCIMGKPISNGHNKANYL